MAGWRRAIGEGFPETRHVIVVASSSGDCLKFSHAFRTAVSSRTRSPLIENSRFPPESIFSITSLDAREWICSIAIAGSQLAKKARTLSAATESVLFNTSRCKSLDASKHLRARSGFPLSSMPRKYEELSQRKFAATPDDLFTCSGTLCIQPLPSGEGMIPRSSP